MKTPTRITTTVRHSLVARLLALLLAISALIPQPNWAAAITVINGADSGAGTLRAALAGAVNGDIINFSLPTPATITLTSGELAVTKHLTIAGPGAALLSISGNTNSRVFNIASNLTVNVSGLTIRNGRATISSPNGGGVFNAGTLTLSNCHVMANQAGYGASGAVRMTGGSGGAGGGVYNSGSLIAVGCTFSGSKGGTGGSGGSAASGQPGGGGGSGGDGGAICSVGSLTMVRCTVSGNHAGVGGQGGYGGLFTGSSGSGGSGGYGGAVFSAGSLTFTSCTTSGNQAGMGGVGGTALGAGDGFGGRGGLGGGIFSSASGDAAILRNNLVALNSYGANAAGAPPGSVGDYPDLAGEFTSQGHNLVGAINGSSGVINGVNGDIAGTTTAPVNPVLGSLQDNGGPTFTRALLACSPALGAGDDTLTGVDQRGLPRLFGAHVDIGAFELQTVLAQDCWTMTSAPTNSWVAVASSTDGTKLVALANNYPTAPVYVSTNSGVTWTQSSVPAEDWVAVASSADGVRLVAAAQTYPTGPVYISTNSGATWTKSSAPAEQWTGVSSSADGTKLVLVAQTYPTGPIYFSTNSGATWVKGNAPAAQWMAVASSADGTRVVAVSQNAPGNVYISTNSGATWTQTTAPAQPWQGVACSAAGDKLLTAASYPAVGPIYRSTNSGTTWSLAAAPDQNWTAITASADASKVAAASYLANSVSGLIFVSTDSGATLSDSGAPIATWTSIASSADGNNLVAAAFGGGIYTRQTTPTFTLRITAIAREGDNVRITWETTPGKTNLVQATSNLAGGFTDLSPQIVIPGGGNSTTNYVDVGGATNSSRFYRIRLGL